MLLEAPPPEDMLGPVHPAAPEDICELVGCTFEEPGGEAGGFTAGGFTGAAGEAGAGFGGAGASVEPVDFVAPVLPESSSGFLWSGSTAGPLGGFTGTAGVIRIPPLLSSGTSGDSSFGAFPRVPPEVAPPLLTVAPPLAG